MPDLSKTFGKLTIPLLVLLAISFWASPARAKYGGGTGEPNDPYLIYTAEQMNEIGLSGNWDDWDKCFKLMADINLAGYTGTDFNIIGSYSNPFTGVFDGNNHTISNFTYTSPGTSWIGLFREVAGENAEIKNLGLLGPNVDSGTRREYAGSLVGYLVSGTITNCYVEGGSVSGAMFIGGLVGNNDGTITNSYAASSVSGDRYVGGLAGYNRGTIINSYSAGSVSGTELFTGGLVGCNQGTISNCYSEAGVSGNRRVGGLLGGNSGTISNSYATGVVGGTSGVGGLLGSNSGAVVSSYWDINTSGQTSSAAGIGKTTAQMQTAATYINWGCGGVWTIDEGVDYPHLVWENLPGVLLTDLLVYAGGSGEPNDPFLIATAGQLNAIGQTTCHWDKHFVLTADIDLSQYTGTEFNIIPYFRGVFDGNGHTISNFTYDCNEVVVMEFIGLFRYVDDPNAEIKNLGLIDSNIDMEGSVSHVGSLVGHLREATITNCYVNGGSVWAKYDVGGLIGVNSGMVTKCYSQANVGGELWAIGGLIGINSGTVTECYSVCDVSGDKWLGGLVGWNGVLGWIRNCYSAGSVTGVTARVGGLVGMNDSFIGEDDYFEGRIYKCYSTSAIFGDGDYFGGLVGKNYGTRGSVRDSFWDIETSGRTTSDGGMGKTTAEMQTQSTFTDAGWDFITPIWKMNCEGMSYPKLNWWQPVLGDFLCPDGVDFFDFSFFAGHWQDDNCGASNDCDGTDLDLLETVDIKDLRIFVDNWLRGF